MGLIYVDLSIGNPSDEHLAPIISRARVSTGTLLLCIPRHIAIQLKLKTFETREVTVADGSRHICDYVGPIQLKYANRQCLTGALVLGEEVLLGAIPIEDMDLVIHPAQLRLVVNPDNPNIAGAIVK